MPKKFQIAKKKAALEEKKTKAAEEKAAEDKQGQNNALDEAVARAAERDKEAADLRRGLEASREQARVDEAFPPRELHPDAEARLRGGAQRMDPRREMARRLLANTGDLTEADLLQYEAILARGHQVGHTPSFPSPPLPSPHVAPPSMWGAEEEEKAARSTPGLFARLQQNGLAPASPGEQAMKSIMQVFKAAGDKEAKKAAEITSFEAFVAFLTKARVLTREYFDSEPDAYWAMDWHFKSVTHIFCIDGWPAAGEYNRVVMKEWHEGFLDVEAMVTSEENRRGHVEGALHTRAHWLAVQRFGTKRTTGTGTKKGGERLGDYGSDKKRNPTDTWCAGHKKFYLVGSIHSTTSCRAKGLRK